MRELQNPLAYESTDVHFMHLRVGGISVYSDIAVLH